MTARTNIREIEEVVVELNKLEDMFLRDSQWSYEIVIKRGSATTKISSDGSDVLSSLQANFSKSLERSISQYRREVNKLLDEMISKKVGLGRKK
jgi:hypothetical protein